MSKDKQRDIRQDPAFPYAWQTNTEEVSPGLTKREFFAATFLQGVICHNWDNRDNDSLAGWAVGLADSLISELNKQPYQKSVQ